MNAPRVDAWGRPLPAGRLLYIKREGVRLGRCYEFAYRVQQRSAARDEQWLLAHGTVKYETSPRWNHAWLISPCGRYYYDAVSDHTLSVDYAQAYMRPRIDKTYTADESWLLQMLGHYGPGGWARMRNRVTR
jgi:hypothetical protein